MPLRLTRAWITRVAVAAALVASSLIAVAPAQAALGGGPAEQTQSLPDLQSATILTNSSSGGGQVDYCFDRAISSGSLGAGVAAKFLLGGYKAANSVAATGVVIEQNQPNGTCVRATFPPSTQGVPAGSGDITQYTIATLLPGGPTGNVPGSSNGFGDSVPLTGSITHNGTTGFTAAPDLSGVTVDTTTNTITYTEDQAIAPLTGVAPTGFFSFTDSAGNVCSLTTAQSTALITGNSSTITVPFGAATCSPGGTASVANAVRATQTFGLFGAAADSAAPNTSDTQIVPSAPNGGATTHPDLVSAQLDPNTPGAMDFTFDQGSLSLGPATSFFADLSTGDQIAGTAGSAAVIGATVTTTTVRVSFANLTNYNEYVVKGSTQLGAMTANGGLVPSTPGSSNAGGNAGAFARGFTTAPDAYSAVISLGTGTMTVSLDQRAFASNALDISSLGVAGTFLANPSNVSLPPQAAGPQAVTLQFTPNQAQTTVNLALENGSANGATAPGNTSGALSNPLTAPLLTQYNVDQIIHVTTTAAIAKAAKRGEALVKKAPKVSKAAAKRAEARSKKAENARLAKLLRQIKAKKHHKK